VVACRISDPEPSGPATRISMARERRLDIRLYCWNLT
jgi:hypothetical protein